MIRDDELHAERLNDAIDALLAGRHVADVADGVPGQLLPLLHVGERLVRAGHRAGAGVRPTFVLALEEQMRTDLRLRLARPVATARRSLLLRAVALLLIGLPLLTFVAQRANPSDSSYPLRTALDAARLRFVQDPSDRAAAALDIARERLLDVQRVVAAGAQEAHVRAVLGDLERTLARALSSAHAAPAHDEALRVQRESRRAAVTLRRIAATDDVAPGTARALRLSADALLALASREAAPEVRVSLGAAGVRRAPSGEGATAAVPAVPEPASTATPTPTTDLATSTVSAHPTQASPTQAVPAATSPPPPPVAPTEASRPGAVEPTAAPSHTPRPYVETATAVAPVPPTSTPDRWPVTSAPPTTVAPPSGGTGVPPDRPIATPPAGTPGLPVP